MRAELEYSAGAMKQRLLEYRESEREIDGQIERLERLITKMTGVGSQVISDMPRNHNASTDRMADMIAQKDELDALIREAINQQANERKFFENLLKQLRKSDERLVIRMRYIDGESWNGVCDMMFGAKDDYDDKRESYLRRVYQVHGHALAHMAQLAAELSRTQR